MKKDYKQQKLLFFSKFNYIVIVPLAVSKEATPILHSKENIQNRNEPNIRLAVSI